MVFPKDIQERRWFKIVMQLQPVLALLGALLITSLVLLTSDTNPIEVFRVLVVGAFSTPIKISDTIALTTPLLLCATGLVITFAAGMYNLGVEGQMAMGAVGAMAVTRLLETAPPPLVWALALLGGILGGAIWAIIVACLKLFGRISEIFAGMGLNFLATGVCLYLVFGPWKRPGTASMSGTQPLPEHLWLPTLSGLRLAPLGPILALIALAIVWFVLARTKWGLSIRAIGNNMNASERMGIPSTRRMIEALACCGALAGLAGALQVLAVFHTLIPNISSGIGLLALLVVLLANTRAAWILPISVLFAVFTVGSTQLPLTLQIDSSISGVLQGALVLTALALRGLKSNKA